VLDIQLTVIARKEDIKMYEIPCKDLSDAEKERLYLLIEECSEVQKQACKILRFGYPDIHPHTKVDNRTILEEELGDLEAVTDLLYNAYDVRHTKVIQQIAKKNEKLKQFTRFQGL
jgi:hypothetical protein